MPEYGGSPNDRPLSAGAQTTWDIVRERGPSTKQDIVEKTKFSERSVRNYLSELFERTLIKEMPSYGRLKIYAAIDYVPIIDETKPLAQRWQVFSPAANKRFAIGELASYYGHGVPASSVKAAELLLKAPALICYYAQENQMEEADLVKQLEALKEVLKEACDQLQSAISVFNQLITDPRYWRVDLLRMFSVSPDFVLGRDIDLIIERLRNEQENVDVSESG